MEFSDGHVQGCVRLLSVLACRVWNRCKCRDASFNSPEFILDDKTNFHGGMYEVCPNH